MDPSIVTQSANFLFDLVYAMFEKITSRSQTKPDKKIKKIYANGEQTTSNSGSEGEGSVQLEVGSVTSSSFAKASQARSDMISELEENLTQSIIRLITMPFRIFWNLVSFVAWLPFNAFIEFSDAFIVKTLSQLGLTKVELKNIAQRVAKKQMLKLKSLCMFLVILLTMFSLSLGFSVSVYLGMYWVMIPSNIVQQQEIFFTYKPIDSQQKNLIKEEAKQGDSMFAHILNDIPMPKLKMVT